MNPPRSRIAWQLAAALALILVLLISGSTLFALRSLDQANIATREEHLASEARLLADQLSTFHGSLRESTQRLASLFEQRFASGVTLHADERVPVAALNPPALYLNGQALNNDFTLVDEFRHLTAGVATVFVRDGEDFVRITTSLNKQDGNRAIGTVLDHAHPAYQRLLSGQNYVGRALLFDRYYMTQYTPVRDSGGQVIAVLFVGFDYTDAQNAQFANLQRFRIGKTGSLALMDETGKWLVTPAGVHRPRPSATPSPRWPASPAMAASGMTARRISSASPCRSPTAPGRWWRACPRRRSARSPGASAASWPSAACWPWRWRWRR